MMSAHFLVVRACLGILLYLDKNVTRNSLERFSLIEYAADYWFVHARVMGVSHVEEAMKQLF
jgi:hypothetical protein